MSAPQTGLNRAPGKDPEKDPELWIALESSSRSASVAVALGSGERVERMLSSERAHASDLLPSVEGALRELDRTPAQIDAVVIGTGPGSYTGLRVGIASALGLAYSCNASLIALPSLNALAFDKLSPGQDGLVIANAHAGALYLASFRHTGDDVEVLREPAVMSPAEVREILREPHGRILTDGFSAQELELSDEPEARITIGSVPGAGALLELGRKQFARRGADDPESIEPLYLRPFQAKPRKR